MGDKKLEVTCKEGDASTGEIIVSDENEVVYSRYAVIFSSKKANSLYEAIERANKRYSI